MVSFISVSNVQRWCVSGRFILSLNQTWHTYLPCAKDIKTPTEFFALPGFVYVVISLAQSDYFSFHSTVPSSLLRIPRDVSPL